jgi:Zn-dependent protease
MRSVRGSFPLGSIFGVAILVHWSWLLVAIFEVKARVGHYAAEVWNVAEYLTLFAIVLAHELGHALACRSVGGQAERILLWPLGGIAFVRPPARPRAVLWSIAAGPLVNLAFLIVSTVPVILIGRMFPSQDFAKYAQAVWGMNLVMLVFNLLPIYPLDGGQIVQALLWFFVGRARSLAIVSVIGLVSAAAIAPIAIVHRSVWFVVLALYAGLRAMVGFRVSRALVAMSAAPRRDGYACPQCGGAQPIGAFWRCTCGQLFDTFATRAQCPFCKRVYRDTACNDCSQMHPHQAFYPAGNA